MTTRDRPRGISGISAGGIVATTLCAAGIYWRYLRHLPDIDTFVFGNLMDGYFCLWVMEHARTFLTSGDVLAYIDPRMFFPDGRLSLFWSVCLFFPALVYSTFVAAGLDLIVGFNLTVYGFVAIGFGACYSLCKTVDELARAEFGTPPNSFATVVLVPLIAYVAAFSEPRMAYTGHFQNFLSAFVFFGAASGLRFVFSASRGSLAGMTGCWVVLVWSDPYHAVMLSALLVVTVALFIACKGVAPLVQALRRNVWVPASGVVLALPMLAGYFAVRESGPQVLGETETKLAHLLTPPSGSRLFAWLHGADWNLAPTPDESLAYAGLILAPIVCVSAGLCAARFVRPLTGIGLTAVIASAASAVAVAAFQLPPSLELTLVVFVVAAAGLAITMALRRGASTVTAFLVIGAFFCYATAFGPSGAYQGGVVDGSPWSLFAVLIPGYASLRAVGRFATLGFTFLLLTIVIGCALLERHQLGRRISRAVVVCAILLTAIVDQTVPPLFARYDFARLTPDPRTAAFFASHPGNILVLPANNLSLIPEYLLLFEHLEGTQLANGYSGRFPARFWDIYGHVDRDIDDAMARKLAQMGINQILWDKRFSTREQVTRKVANFGGEVLFENEYVFVSTFPGSSGNVKTAPAPTFTNPIVAGICEAQSMTGFHRRERWGVWSETDPSTIVLTKEVSGPVTLRLVAYGLPGPSQRLTVTLGNVQRTVDLSSRPTSFDLKYTIARPTNTISLQGIVPRRSSAPTDTRSVAVGLVRIDCLAGDSKP